jgi:hypothetical protein
MSKQYIPVQPKHPVARVPRGSKKGGGGGGFAIAIAIASAIAMCTRVSRIDGSFFFDF